MKVTLFDTFVFSENLSDLLIMRSKHHYISRFILKSILNHGYFYFVSDSYTLNMFKKAAKGINLITCLRNDPDKLKELICSNFANFIKPPFDSILKFKSQFKK